MKTKYYKCQNCNAIITEEEILKEIEGGGSGMCYCEFDNGRMLNKYKRISKKEYEKIRKMEGNKK